MNKPYSLFPDSSLPLPRLSRFATWSVPPSPSEYIVFGVPSGCLLPNQYIAVLHKTVPRPVSFLADSPSSSSISHSACVAAVVMHLLAMSRVLRFYLSCYKLSCDMVGIGVRWRLRLPESLLPAIRQLMAREFIEKLILSSSSSMYALSSKAETQLHVNDVTRSWYRFKNFRGSPCSLQLISVEVIAHRSRFLRCSTNPSSTRSLSTTPESHTCRTELLPAARHYAAVISDSDNLIGWSWPAVLLLVEHSFITVHHLPGCYMRGHSCDHDHSGLTGVS